MRSHARTVWEEGHEPGPQVVALGIAVALTVVVLDIAMTDRVSWVFDLFFVVLCVGLALAVRPADFFTVGVLPPLIMVGVFTLLALSRPEVLADAQDSPVQAVITGLSHHSLALVIGYLLCLACLAVRQRYVERSTEQYAEERSALTR